MSSRDRQRRRAMIEALVAKQAYVNTLRQRLQPPVLYLVYGDPENAPVLAHKQRTIH